MAVGNVKGVLFADYVRMLRMRKDIDWSQSLDAQDLGFVLGRVALDGWYPMDVFERLGNAILTHIARESPMFVSFKVEEIFTFLDLLKLLGFEQLTVTDGDRFAHQILIK